MMYLAKGLILLPTGSHVVLTISLFFDGAQSRVRESRVRLKALRVQRKAGSVKRGFMQSEQRAAIFEEKTSKRKGEKKQCLIFIQMCSGVSEIQKLLKSKN